MLQSRLFSKTSKTLPEGEGSKNAQLLIKAGFINKSSAGVYSLLPLGLRVFNKINQIIREEMNVLGAEELLFPTLIHKKYWQQSNRWDLDVIYKTNTGKQKDDFEYGLGWTHEEVVTAIAKHFINSYKDLPKYVYQIQTKFRAEPRAQAGLLRGREFSMKDLYSFHVDKEDLDDFYQKVLIAYKKIFKRMDLKVIVTEAAGGAFTKEYTHECQVLHPAGEDTVHYCELCRFSQNSEIFDSPKHINCKGELKTSRAIEVANVFKLGTKFSQDFNLTYLDKNGQSHLVVMGSYGIGPSRILGTLVEVNNDEKGIMWPAAVAPFKVHLIRLGDTDPIKKEADAIYRLIGQKGNVEVLYDDRSVSAGEKLNDADLLGMPWRVVVSEKTIAAKKIEVKQRSEKMPKLINLAGLKRLLAL